MANFLQKKRIDRRTLLKGSGGVLVSLPALEIMGIFDSALAQQSIRKKYLICFQANSYSVQSKFPTNNLPAFSLTIPENVGSNYDVKPGFGILNSYPALKPYTTIVSGLKVPLSGPANIGEGSYHQVSLSPVLLGTTTKGNKHSGSISSDLIAGRALKANAIIDSFAVRTSDARSDRLKAVMSQENYQDRTITSVTAAMNKIFPGLGSGNANDGDANLDRKILIMDQILESKNTLLMKASATDKVILEEYFERVHDTEKMFNSQRNITCEPFDAADFTQSGIPKYQQELILYRELIALGFQCDIFHSAAMMIMHGQGQNKDVNSIMSNNRFNFLSQSDRNKIKPFSSDYHELGHFKGGPDQRFKVTAVNNWALDHFFYIAEKLRSIPSGNGNLLDSSGLVFTWESGCHFKNSKGGGFSSEVHSGENKLCLVVGKAGNLKAGQHIYANGKHPASLVLAVMQQLGVNVSKFGEIAAPLTEIVA